MLHLSNGTITPVKSSYFFRLALVIHGFAIYMLCRSSLLFSIKLPVLLLLLYVLSTIFFKQSQFIPFKKLIFQAGKWQLFDKKGQDFTYEQLRVILEAGIFFLLELSNDDEQKTIVVFFDQIAADDYRSLKLIEKVC